MHSLLITFSIFDGETLRQLTKWTSVLSQMNQYVSIKAQMRSSNRLLHL